jgi:hypothetical protein
MQCLLSQIPQLILMHGLFLTCVGVDDARERKRHSTAKLAALDPDLPRGLTATYVPLPLSQRPAEAALLNFPELFPHSTRNPIREHEPGVAHALGRRLQVRWVSPRVTNLYSALLDFTVESTGPVFTPLTDKLSDHEELRA